MSSIILTHPVTAMTGRDEVPAVRMALYQHRELVLKQHSGRQLERGALWYRQTEGLQAATLAGKVNLQF